MSDAVVASIITGAFALTGIVWQSRKTRRLNTEEHGSTGEKLDRIETKVDRTDAKVDGVADELHRHEAVHHRAKRRW